MVSVAMSTANPRGRLSPRKGIARLGATAEPRAVAKAAKTLARMAGDRGRSLERSAIRTYEVAFLLGVAEAEVGRHPGLTNLSPGGWGSYDPAEVYLLVEHRPSAVKSLVGMLTREFTAPRAPHRRELPPRSTKP